MASSPGTDPELEAMMAEPESDRVERKESAADRERIRRNICALANDLPRHGRPGVILVGVRDNGDCANLPITDKLLSLVSGLGDGGPILPLPSLVVRRRRGCEAAVILAQPSSAPPVRFRGRIRVQVGPTLRQAHLGFSQRFGMGLPLARQALEGNGNPRPRFDIEPTGVGVTVRAAR